MGAIPNGLILLPHHIAMTESIEAHTTGGGSKRYGAWLDASGHLRVAVLIGDHATAQERVIADKDRTRGHKGGSKAIVRRKGATSRSDNAAPTYSLTIHGSGMTLLHSQQGLKGGDTVCLTIPRFDVDSYCAIEVVAESAASGNSLSYADQTPPSATHSRSASHLTWATRTFAKARDASSRPAVGKTLRTSPSNPIETSENVTFIDEAIMAARYGGAGEDVPETSVNPGVFSVIIVPQPWGEDDVSVGDVDTLFGKTEQIEKDDSGLLTIGMEEVMSVVYTARDGYQGAMKRVVGQLVALIHAF